MVTNKTWFIDIIDENDIPNVIEFFRTFFYKDEPISKWLGFENNTAMEELDMATVPEHCSFKAVDANGKIIGCSINGIVNKPVSGATNQLYSDSIQDPTVKTWAKFIEYIDVQFNLFDLYPTADKYLDVNALSVDGRYRGQGIAQALVEESREYAKVHEIPLISMLCSSIFSAGLCKKNGSTRAFTLRYDDHIVDGHKPIQPDEPHESVQIWVEEIQKTASVNQKLLNRNIRFYSIERLHNQFDCYQN